MALTALYHRALPLVYGYLLPRCGSAGLAEYLTADTFHGGCRGAQAGSSSGSDSALAGGRRASQAALTLRYLDGRPVAESPGNSAAAFTAPGRSRSGRGLRSAASTRRGKATIPDPIEALRLPVIPVEPRPEFAASLLRRLSSEQVPARGAT